MSERQKGTKPLPATGRDSRPQPQRDLAEFGFLRLFFASLVIVSHTPELHDGDRSHEVLTQAFGTLSCGDLAVDSFFFISGFLITGSYLRSASPARYLRKRIARIYPGFVVASLVCWFLVQPLGGGALPHTLADWLSAAVRVLLLQAPDLGPVFRGTWYPYLDGPMWTIAYEFLCYLLVYALGRSGLLRTPRTVLALNLLFLILTTQFIANHAIGHGDMTHKLPLNVVSTSFVRAVLAGAPLDEIRLIALFLTGSAACLLRHRIVFRPHLIVAAAVLMLGCLMDMRLAHAGVALFGGYLILGAAHAAPGTALARINRATDLSYGTYLYAWPVTKLIFWFRPDTAVPLAGLATLGAAGALGWLSWHLVERRAIAYAASR